jgi:hypothetical protein
MALKPQSFRLTEEQDAMLAQMVEKYKVPRYQIVMRVLTKFFESNGVLPPAPKMRKTRLGNEYLPVKMHRNILGGLNAYRSEYETQRGERLNDSEAAAYILSDYLCSKGYIAGGQDFDAHGVLRPVTPRPYCFYPEGTSPEPARQPSSSDDEFLAELIAQEQTK